MIQNQATSDYYKYCPGEERVRISNAICVGRRRSHYPKCRGCQFNDDETDRTASGASSRDSQSESSVPATLNRREDRSSTTSDVASLFHASNISGTTPVPLSEDVAWRIGHAAAHFLRSKLRGYDRADPDTRSVIVGRDTRQHSAALEQALIEGIRSTGTDVVSLGVIDTPQLYFAVNQLGACGGFQVAGGRLPAEYNGIRICGAKATPTGIETGLSSIRDIADRIPRHETGATSRLITRDLSDDYATFARDFLISNKRLPHPIRIVVDASNGAAGCWFPIVFKGIRNLRISRLNFDHKGEFAHPPDPSAAKNTRMLRSQVKEESADFGICFDSSGEHCTFVDDKARTLRPDFTLALLARIFLQRQQGATIVYDHRSSAAVEEEIIRAGGVPIRERNSSAQIKKTMSERDAILGGDLAGRFFFRDSSFNESGILAFVHMINLLITSGRKLSELIRPLQRYSTSGDLRYHCTDPERVLNQVMAAHQAALIEEHDGLTIRYPDWWFNVRPYPGQRLLRVTLEARSRTLVDQRLAELQPILGERA